MNTVIVIVTIAILCYAAVTCPVLHIYIFTVVNCGSLTDIPNGAVDTSGGTNYKCTAVYTCDTGYVLNGNITRTCQEDAMWSGSEPTCDGTYVDL